MKFLCVIVCCLVTLCGSAFAETRNQLLNPHQLDVVEMQNSIVSEMLDAESSDAIKQLALNDERLNNYLVKLTLAGWTYSINDAIAERIVNTAGNGDVESDNANELLRLAIPLVLAGDPRMKANIFFTTTRENSTEIAFAPHSDDPNQLGLESLVSTMERYIEKTAAQLLAESGKHDSKSAGLKDFSCTYVKSLSTSVACFALWSNPFGYLRGVVYRSGTTANGTGVYVRTFNGCAYICPEKVAIRLGYSLCGIPKNTCTGF